MSPKYLDHFLAVGRASCRDTDHFGRFAKVRRPHDRRRYDRELFHVIAAEIVEAVYRAARDTKRLPRTNLDGCPVNRPGKDAFDTIDNLLVSVVFVGRGGQHLPDWDAKLKHGCTAEGIFTGNEEADTYWTNLDGFF